MFVAGDDQTLEGQQQRLLPRDIKIEWFYLESCGEEL